MKNPAATGNQLNILQTQHFSSLLSDFEINLEEFVATINNSFGTIADQSMAVNLIESLRTILETATETYENPDTEGLEMILLLTSDKGNMLQKIRQEYFQKNTSVDIADRQAIYTLTLLFERMYWFLKTMTVIKMKTFPEEHSFSPAIAPMG
jgi:hypothetical protein